VALLKDAIKRRFHFPVRRLRTRHQTEHIELPPILKDFVVRSSSLETAVVEDSELAQTGSQRLHSPEPSQMDSTGDSDFHPDPNGFQKQPVHAQNGSKGEQKMMIAKLPPELHLNAPKIVSDLRLQESGHVTFTDFNVSDNGDCFLRAGAQVWNNAHASTIEVRRDEDGYHVVIPMSRKYIRGPLPVREDNLPVASVTIGPEGK
jgi:hypothetical protein